jgi:hypothetical protein
MAYLGSELIDLAFQDVADGEDPDQAAVILDYREVSPVVIDHHGGRFGDGGSTGG